MDVLQRQLASCEQRLREAAEEMATERDPHGQGMGGRLHASETRAEELQVSIVTISSSSTTATTTTTAAAAASTVMLLHHPTWL